MRIIFLDIDGVLNGDRWWASGDRRQINEPCVLALNQILGATDAAIVLSSAWRHMVLLGNMTCIGFQYLLVSHGVVKCRVIGTTRHDRMTDDCPNPPPGMVAVDPCDTRGQQISDWLACWKGRPIPSYIVLDDDDDGISGVHPSVITDGEVGLTEADAEKAIDILMEAKAAGGGK